MKIRPYFMAPEVTLTSALPSPTPCFTQDRSSVGVCWVELD